jgi:SAM-dependent methyltransferase
VDPRLEVNRANWDDRVPIHAASTFYDVAGWLAPRPGLRPWERALVGDVAGLDVVHLQCHFGLDTLMLAQAGARVTGVDIAPAAVAQATELAERAGLVDRATFVEANVYDAPHTFDLVYVSLGALCWLPRVRDWAAQVAALLRPGGRLFLHDTHPLSHTLSYDDSLTITWSYFEEPEPWVEESEHTYTDGDVKLTNTRSYEWNHSIGEVVTALLAEGLRLTHLEEHDWTVFHRHPSLEEQPDGRWALPEGAVRIPLSYTLMAAKSG